MKTFIPVLVFDSVDVSVKVKVKVKVLLHSKMCVAYCYIIWMFVLHCAVGSELGGCWVGCAVLVCLCVCVHASARVGFIMANHKPSWFARKHVVVLSKTLKTKLYKHIAQVLCKVFCLFFSSNVSFFGKNRESSGYSSKGVVLSLVQVCFSIKWMS